MQASFNNQFAATGRRPRQLTRIVATLGPASSSREMVKKLMRRGVDVFRLNMSHGSREEHRQVYETIRELEDEQGVNVPVLLDISGPKLRFGPMEGDLVTLDEGAEVLLVKGEEPGSSEKLPVGSGDWFASIKPGHRVLVGDGDVQLEVLAAKTSSLQCRVMSGGSVRSRQGINLPDTELELGAVTDKDWQDIEFGLELGVDAFALSFVQGPDDLIAVRRYIRRKPNAPLLIAKIEQPQAVKRFEEILQRSDGIMVARGDLGITLPLERIPVIQKALIERTRASGKFVITATQMLESMTHSPRPTRAEVTDVANAVYDATDAVMLSGETAIGEHPETVVDHMVRILQHAEPAVRLQSMPAVEGTIEGAIARVVKDLVEELKASAILVPISSGSTPRRLSRQRTGAPILVGTLSQPLARQLVFHMGVFPVVVPDAPDGTVSLQRLVDAGLEQAWLKEGDNVVVAGGIPQKVEGITNFVRVYRVGDPV